MASKKILTCPPPGDFITIEGARQNNLRNLTLRLPLRKLIVVTGVSGSGKSSLAFDTLYSEGQRRYVETFSSYTRQFLDRMDKPRVDRIEGIPPAIAIDQTNPVRTSRSTVGTMTELNDHLKLLFARASRLYCGNCGREVRRDTPETIVEQLPGRAEAPPHLPRHRAGQLHGDGGQGAPGEAGLHPHPREGRKAAGGAAGPGDDERGQPRARRGGPRGGAEVRPGTGERARRWTGPDGADGRTARPCGSPRTCTAPSATSTTTTPRPTCSRSTRRSAPAPPAAVSAAPSASTGTSSYPDDTKTLAGRRRAPVADGELPRRAGRADEVRPQARRSPPTCRGGSSPRRSGRG